MSVSRRLRYEILRRDDHACRYCGATAPDVKLTVDHVIPIALGGGDEASNLVTACADCNAGKSSSSADAPIVDGVADDAIRWARAMRAAADNQSYHRDKREAYVAAFDRAWCRWRYNDGQGEPVSRPPDWAAQIGRHYDRGTDLAAIVALVHDVVPRNVPDDRMWRYFCGALRNVTEEQQRLAREFLDVEMPA
jgi:hypothetical protein